MCPTAFLSPGQNLAGWLPMRIPDLPGAPGKRAPDVPAWVLSTRQILTRRVSFRTPGLLEPILETGVFLKTRKPKKFNPGGSAPRPPKIQKIRRSETRNPGSTREDTPKPHAAAPATGTDVAAEGAASVALIAAPRAAPQHPGTAFLRALWIKI